MPLNTGKSKRYCSTCHCRHGYQLACSQEKEKEKEKQKRYRYRHRHHHRTPPSTQSQSKSRKRRHQELVSCNDPNIQTNTRSVGLGLSLGQKQKQYKPKDDTCPICLEVRGRQQTLGCGHSMCPECYASMTQPDPSSRVGVPPAKKAAKCPLCRAEMFRGQESEYYCRTSYRHRRSYRLVETLSLDDSDDEDDFPLTEQEMLEEFEREEQEEQEERDFGLAQDMMLLSEALELMYRWKNLGGDLISNAMEKMADLMAGAPDAYLKRPDVVREKSRLGLQLDRAQARLVCQLVEIWNALYTVDPPEDPYGWEGQVLGELRRLFGYSTWVTQVDLEKLRPQNEAMGIRQLIHWNTSTEGDMEEDGPPRPLSESDGIFVFCAS